tara:strand:+ start:141 stop:260 length:120 start_codon:yes stop_codon:yes gene_type:complete
MDGSDITQGFVPSSGDSLYGFTPNNNLDGPQGILKMLAG